MRAIEWSDANFASAAALCRVAAECYGRGWVPATSGNFSFRERDTGRVFVTASGLDKGAITPDDLLELDEHGHVLAGSASGWGSPSAETVVHMVIYRQFPEVGAIVHSHSIWNTLAGDLLGLAGNVEIAGYELLKALSGVLTHEHVERVPVLENSQDYVTLALTLEGVLARLPEAHGVLLKRHGLYTWGESVAGARRHIEALEWLFEVIVRKRQSV